MSIAWQGPEVKDSHIYSKIKKGKEKKHIYHEIPNKQTPYTKTKQTLIRHDTIEKDSHCNLYQGEI
jgi:hypothetical protein